MRLAMTSQQENSKKRKRRTWRWKREDWFSFAKLEIHMPSDKTGWVEASLGIETVSISQVMHYQ